MKDNLTILKFYSFHSHSAEKDIADFLSCLDNNFSANNDLLTLEMENNFYTMINNFEIFMQYANIDEKWQLLNKREDNNLIFNIINKTKMAIKKMLINGLLNSEYTNLIFEFNKQKPFVKSTQTIYKLLINAMLYTCFEHEIHIEQSLSLYLMHAAIYNNSDAIQILLEEYHVSPINTWPAINMVTNKMETMIMPIIQITNFEKMEIDKKASGISRETQEYNFMLMLNNIIFFKPTISTWQKQEIFRCAFRNKFFQALNILLAQEPFCENLMLAENDLMTIAFSCVSLPEYCYLLNSILNNQNILTTATPQANNTALQLRLYINFLQGMLTYQFDCINCIKNNHKPLTVLWDIINSVLIANPEQKFILNYLIIMKNIQEILIKENDKLLKNNLTLQAGVSTLTHQLADLNLKHLILQTHQQEYLNSKYLVLQYELGKDQQTFKESINSKQETVGYNSSASLRRHSL